MQKYPRFSPKHTKDLHVQHHQMNKHCEGELKSVNELCVCVCALCELVNKNAIALLVCVFFPVATKFRCSHFRKQKKTQRKI